jgi:hypothetical protein
MRRSRAMRDESKTFLTINEVLREFPGLSVRGFTRAVSSGQVQVYRFDAWRRVHRDDVRAWIERHRHPGGRR